MELFGVSVLLLQIAGFCPQKSAEGTVLSVDKRGEADVVEKIF